MSLSLFWFNGIDQHIYKERFYLEEPSDRYIFDAGLRVQGMMPVAWYMMILVMWGRERFISLSFF